MTHLEGQLPSELSVAAPSPIKGALPTPPTQKDSTEIEFAIDFSVASAHELTTAVVAERLRDFDWDPDLKTATNELNKHSITTPANTEITLSSLVQPKIVTVKRPIVIQNK